MLFPMKFLTLLLPFLSLLPSADASDKLLRRTQEEEEEFGDLPLFQATPDEKNEYVLPFGQTIVGGTAAAAGEYPYFVSLEFNGQVYCGGTLISPNRVLSAAHCFFTQSGAIFLPTNIRVGHTTTSNGETIVPSCVSIHPEYGADFQGLYNDVAVISLMTASTTVTTFSNLNADTAYPATAGQALTAIGFGRTVTGGSTSTTLLKVNENFVPQATCNNDWTCADIANHVCASGGSGKGVCQGDSGGPLFDANKVQVGVTSFGSGQGCATGIPNVFANVGAYNSWIVGELTSGTCTSSHTMNPNTPCNCFCIFRGAFNDARKAVLGFFASGDNEE